MEKRFFVERKIEEKVQVGSTLLIENSEHQHLSKVMRLKENDLIECFYDNSPVFLCKIENISKNQTTAVVEKIFPATANPKGDITLFQGLPKLDKLEFVCQKLCELGAGEVVPFVSSFCNAKANPKKQERINKIVVSACKQCGRTNLLNVKNAVKFKEMLTQLSHFDIVIFANEKEQNFLLNEALKNLSTKQKIAIIVGSEGGFSDSEINEIAAFSNVKSVCLGKRILRTETASVAITASVSFAIQN